MALAILYVTAFLVLFLCKFILLHNIAAPPRQEPNVFVQGLHNLRQVRMAVFEDGLNDVDPADRDRAETYLHRIIALTGAKRMNDYCVLDVGKTRFYVHDGYVVRLRDVTDPQCTHEETCFYMAYQGMPVAEIIATALLQLKNNPALFDGWLAKKAAFKADGLVFKFRCL